jgi:hemerythrin-like metal-binding protein
MSYFFWSDAMSVGNRYIDADHQAMINIINHLHDAMRDGKGDEVLRKVLGELLVYTKGHFDREEAQMRAINFSGYAGHKRQHELLLNKFAQFNRSLRGSSAEAIRISNFLNRWLTSHILKSDMVLGAAIKAAALGAIAPGVTQEAAMI